MSRGLEDEIFDAGQATEDTGAPEPQDLPNAPRPEDAAVSQIIGELAKGTGRQTTPAQPQPQQPPQAQPQQQPDEDRSQGGILRALLDEREKRQEMQQRLRRFEEQEAAAKQQRPPMAQRLFEDPESVLEEIRQSIREESVTPLEQRMAQMAVQTDFALAEVRHGDAFKEAWQAWYQQVDGGKDPQSYFAVMQAQSPGEALIQWHRQQQVQSEVGGDLNSYKERLRAEILAELGMQQGAPAPQPSAERLPNGQFAPKQQVRLPTATSRMGNGSTKGGGIADNLDGSDDAIFDSARTRR